MRTEEFLEWAQAAKQEAPTLSLEVAQQTWDAWQADTNHPKQGEGDGLQLQNHIRICTTVLALDDTLAVMDAGAKTPIADSESHQDPTVMNGKTTNDTLAVRDADAKRKRKRSKSSADVLSAFSDTCSMVSSSSATSSASKPASKARRTSD